jgi:hypothetical protein
LLDSETGEMVDAVLDRRVDEHFNCLLDALADWRAKSKGRDVSLQGNHLLPLDERACRTIDDDA